MKIGIISFHNAQIEDAPLALTLLCEYLKQQGHEVELIDFRLKCLETRKAKATLNAIHSEKVAGYELQFTENYSEYSALYGAALQYDALIAYGNELWNPVFTKAVRSAYFLDFANADALRIAYAVGASELPDYNKLQIQKYLRDFDAISVCNETSLEKFHSLTTKEIVPVFEELNEQQDALSCEAQAFLSKALAGKKDQKALSYLESKDVFSCTGCGTCKDVCPAGAIHMEEDEEGFLYPVKDASLCQNCNACKAVCAGRQNKQLNAVSQDYPVVYAAYHQKEAIQKTSSCGGMFTPMYQHILEQGGRVVGVRFDENWNAVYDIASTAEECESFRGVKYMMADSKAVKPQVKELLDKEIPVLFTGTPCQIAALKNYLGKTYLNLYTVEVMCSGAGSPKIFRKYVEHLEAIYKSKLSRFQFRNKFKHTGTPFVFVEFESGVCDVEVAKRNNVSKALTSGVANRPSCYTCAYVGAKQGVADITIGNYMGIKDIYPEFAHAKGVSVLKINTPQGRVLLEAVKLQLVLMESNCEDAYKNNSKKPKTLKGNRARLFENLESHPIDELLLSFNPEKESPVEGL